MVFNAQDLQRVRLAGAADPMWELTPAGLVTDFDAGCEALTHTSQERVTADVIAAFRKRSPQLWVRTLAAGDRDAVKVMLRAVRAAHDLLLAPYWVEVQEVVAAERERQAGVLADHGLGGVLRRIPGVLGWDGGVLRVRYPETRTVHLAGRGLVLLPSYFCWCSPVTWIDPGLPPVLVYQARRVTTSEKVGVKLSDAVMTLLGCTCAECLRLSLTPRSTSEIAEQLGTSAGTVSKQTAVLRDAGLITSTRRGTSVLHAITPLGTALLCGRMRTPY
ncbi:ArsR/SmtB family transcription factor [Amycolatopsis pretoriensis]|nr:helix-turn-helix domain-containing protein [Amycolatopsis pretoriensis]